MKTSNKKLIQKHIRNKHAKSMRELLKNKGKIVTAQSIAKS